MTPPRILECTLRDGSYVINFQFTEEETRTIVAALESVGFDPHTDFDGLAERVREEGEPVAWRGPGGEHRKLAIAPDLELRLDRDEGEDFATLLPYYAERARLRMNASLIAETCTAAVTGAFQFIGGTGLRTSHPIQRIFRDAQAVLAHDLNNAQRAAENLGRVSSGLTNKLFFL